MMYYPQNLQFNSGSDPPTQTEFYPTHYKNIPLTVDNYQRIHDRMMIEMSPTSQKPYILAMSRLKHQSQQQMRKFKEIKKDEDQYINNSIQNMKNKSADNNNQKKRKMAQGVNQQLYQSHQSQMPAISQHQNSYSMGVPSQYEKPQSGFYPTNQSWNLHQQNQNVYQSVQIPNARYRINDSQQLFPEIAMFADKAGQGTIQSRQQLPQIISNSRFSMASNVADNNLNQSLIPIKERPYNRYGNRSMNNTGGNKMKKFLSQSIDFDQSTELPPQPSQYSPRGQFHSVNTMKSKKKQPLKLETPIQQVIFFSLTHTQEVTPFYKQVNSSTNNIIQNVLALSTNCKKHEPLGPFNIDKFKKKFAVNSNIINEINEQDNDDSFFTSPYPPKKTQLPLVQVQARAADVEKLKSGKLTMEKQHELIFKILDNQAKIHKSQVSDIKNSKKHKNLQNKAHSLLSRNYPQDDNHERAMSPFMKRIIQNLTGKRDVTTFCAHCVFQDNAKFGQLLEKIKEINKRAESSTFGQVASNSFYGSTKLKSFHEPTYETENEKQINMKQSPNKPMKINKPVLQQDFNNQKKGRVKQKEREKFIGKQVKSPDGRLLKDFTKNFKRKRKERSPHYQNQSVQPINRHLHSHHNHNQNGPRRDHSYDQHFYKGQMNNLKNKKGKKEYYRNRSQDFGTSEDDSNKKSVSKDVVDRLHGKYYKGRHICSTCHRVTQYGHFHTKKRTRSEKKLTKKGSPKKNSTKKQKTSGVLNKDIKKKSPKKVKDDGELEYVSLELRPCSEKVSCHSLALSPLDLSICDESIQFKYEEKVFEQQYSFHVDVMSNCIQTLEIPQPKRPQLQDMGINTEVPITPPKLEHDTPRASTPKEELFSGRALNVPFEIGTPRDQDEIIEPDFEEERTRFPKQQNKRPHTPSNASSPRPISPPNHASQESFKGMTYTERSVASVPKEQMVQIKTSRQSEAPQIQQYSPRAVTPPFDGEPEMVFNSVDPQLALNFSPRDIEEDIVLTPRDPSPKNQLSPRVPSPKELSLSRESTPRNASERQNQADDIVDINKSMREPTGSISMKSVQFQAQIMTPRNPTEEDESIKPSTPIQLPTHSTPREATPPHLTNRLDISQRHPYNATDREEPSQKFELQSVPSAPKTLSQRPKSELGHSMPTERESDVQKQEALVHSTPREPTPT